MSYSRFTTSQLPDCTNAVLKSHEPFLEWDRAQNSATYFSTLHGTVIEHNWLTLPPGFIDLYDQYLRYAVTASALEVSFLPSTYNYAACIYPSPADVLPYSIPWDRMTQQPGAVWAYVTTNSDVVTLKTYVNHKDITGSDVLTNLTDTYVTPQYYAKGWKTPLHWPTAANTVHWNLAVRFSTAANALTTPVRMDYGVAMTWYTRWIGRKPLSSKLGLPETE